MKALHIFPMFGDDLTAGSDYVQHRLTVELARRGVDVEVLTTCTQRIEPNAAFGLGWPSQYPAGPTLVDGVRVRRFPVRFAPGPALGHALSRPIISRWQREESALGIFPRGSDAAVAAFQRRALARPPLYDYLALLGRGPHSPGLAAAARRAAAHCDVVLAGFIPFATLRVAAAAARRHRKPLVLLPLFHPEDVYHHFRLFYRWLQQADALLAQTSYSARLFERLAPGARPLEVGIGVDPAELTDPQISGARFRLRHGFGDAPLVLFVGRKELHKRYDIAVDAIDRAADPRARLVMIGTDVDHQPLTSPRAVHLGPLPRAELLDAYDACDIFVLPSEHESFGIVFLEAWMRGKPVIGNRACQPVAALISDGRDGLLAADAGELREQIDDLLDDPARARALGAAGRAKVLARYTWEHIGTTVHALYERLAAQRAR